jgi:bifunctional non-homologous end joining protein LigD
MSLRTVSRPAKSGFIEPCLPTPAARPPAGARWLHEIKQDGYRLMARRDAGGVRLLTRNGHEWTDRYPSIAHAINILRCRSCLIDGEAIVVDPDTGIALFEAMRGGARIKPQAQLYAFDLIALDGVDLRREPIEARKAALANLLGAPHNSVQRASITSGIFLAEHIEGDGEFIFRHACRLGCEGVVSKLKGSAYSSGRSRDWIKSKNPEHPAYTRVLEEDWNG